MRAAHEQLHSNTNMNC